MGPPRGPATTRRDAPKGQASDLVGRGHPPSERCAGACPHPPGDPVHRPVPNAHRPGSCCRTGGTRRRHRPCIGQQAGDGGGHRTATVDGRQAGKARLRSLTGGPGNTGIQSGSGTERPGKQGSASDEAGGCQTHFHRGVGGRGRSLPSRRPRATSSDHATATRTTPVPNRSRRTSAGAIGCASRDMSCWCTPGGM